MHVLIIWPFSIYSVISYPQCWIKFKIRISTRSLCLYKQLKSINKGLLIIMLRDLYNKIDYIYALKSKDAQSFRLEGALHALKRKLDSIFNQKKIVCSPIITQRVELHFSYNRSNVSVVHKQKTFNHFYYRDMFEIFILLSFQRF